MAKGGGFRKFQTIMGLIGLLSLVVVYSVVTGWNPLPSWADWIRNHTDVTLSDPPTGWVKRAATTGRGHRLPRLRGRVRRRLGRGAPGDRRRPGVVADRRWAATAGDAQPVVVAASVDNPGGFDVYDMETGLKLWSDKSKDAVWPYRDKLLILHCASATACELRAVDPATGKAKWSVTLSGAGRSLHGLRPAFAGLVPLTGEFGAGLDAMPHAAPPLIGLRLGDDLHVVATRDGRNVRTYHPDREHRIIVAGREVVVATAVPRGEVCYPTLSGRDPESDDVLWTRAGTGAGTTGGYDCDERSDPVGTGPAMLVTGTDGKQALLDVRDRTYLFKVPPGDKVVATDGELAVIRAQKGSTVYAVDLGDGTRLWSHAADPHAMVAVAPDAVVIADPGNEHLVVVSRDKGAMCSSRAAARWSSASATTCWW